MATRTGLPCYHIETLKELDIDSVKKYSVVGVTAGASTPDFLIDESAENSKAYKAIKKIYPP